MSGDNNLKVLNALDGAKTQWYHFTAIIIAGMGFFTDAYDLFCISLVTKMLGRIYYHVDGSPKPGSLPPNVSAAVNGVALCGTLAGQLFFGWLGDKMGRKKVYGATLMLRANGKFGPKVWLLWHSQYIVSWSWQLWSKSFLNLAIIVLLC
ncbi:putative inorganic phosphate transporter 1-7 [Orobanche gracilis]